MEDIAKARNGDSYVAVSNGITSQPAYFSSTQLGNVWVDGDFANLLNTSNEANIDFRIQNEDFPALTKTTDGNAANDDPETSETHGDISIDTAKLMRSFPEARLDSQTQSNGGVLKNQFGLLGLLSFIRGIQEDLKSVVLTVGEDLTSLGLDLLNQKREVCPTFGGPWSSQPCRAHDIDVMVPLEYLTNTSIRNRLPSIKLSKLSDDVLFHLFYNFPREVYQAAAAAELYNRDWRYHMSLHVWLTRSQHGGVKEQTTTYEKGSYNVFDPVQWRKVTKELKLEYKELEGRPKLPESLLPISVRSANQNNVADACKNAS